MRVKRVSKEGVIQEDPLKTLGAGDTPTIEEIKDKAARDNEKPIESIEEPILDTEEPGRLERFLRKAKEVGKKVVAVSYIPLTIIGTAIGVGAQEKTPAPAPKDRGGIVRQQTVVHPPVNTTVKHRRIYFNPYTPTYQPQQQSSYTGGYIIVYPDGGTIRVGGGIYHQQQKGRSSYSIGVSTTGRGDLNIGGHIGTGGAVYYPPYRSPTHYPLHYPTYPTTYPRTPTYYPPGYYPTRYNPCYPPTYPTHPSWQGPPAIPYRTGPRPVPYRTGPPAVPYTTGPPSRPYTTGPPSTPYRTGPEPKPYTTGPPAVPYTTGPPSKPYETKPPGASSKTETKKQEPSMNPSFVIRADWLDNFIYARLKSGGRVREDGSASPDDVMNCINMSADADGNGLASGGEIREFMESFDKDTVDAMMNTLSEFPHKRPDGKPNEMTVEDFKAGKIAGQGFGLVERNGRIILNSNKMVPVYSYPQAYVKRKELEGKGTTGVSIVGSMGYTLK